MRALVCVVGGGVCGCHRPENSQPILGGWNILHSRTGDCHCEPVPGVAHYAETDRLGNLLTSLPGSSLITRDEESAISLSERVFVGGTAELTNFTKSNGITGLTRPILLFTHRPKSVIELLSGRQSDKPDQAEG